MIGRYYKRMHSARVRSKGKKGEEVQLLPRLWFLSHLFRTTGFSSLFHIQALQRAQYITMPIESAGIETIVVDTVSPLQSVIDEVVLLPTNVPSLLSIWRDTAWPAWFNIYPVALFVSQEEGIPHRYTYTGN